MARGAGCTLEGVQEVAAPRSAAPVSARPKSYREAMTLGGRIPEGQSGPWKIERFTVSLEDSKWDRLSGHGRGCPPGTYTRLVDTRRSFDAVMMSDTPDEMRDHAEAYFQAQKLGGRALVHGLGLGMVTQALLSLENIEHVDCVELDPDVIALVSPAFQEEIDAGRLTIHQGDCFTKEWPKEARWSVVWSDIWRDLCTDNLDQMAILRRRFNKRCCTFHGCWGREYLLDRRRREKRQEARFGW